jgi:DNA polymerase III delta prime subunit
MENILGQSRAIDILQAGLQTGRLHHAYIFHGPRGVGKYTAAREFARSLLCHDPQRDLAGRILACGGCASCKAMVAPPPAIKPEGKRGGAKRKASDDEEGEEETETPITEADAFDREPHPDYHVIRKELAAMSSITELRKRKQMNIPIDLLRELMIGGKTMDGAYHDSLAFKSPRLNHNKVFIIDEAELLDVTGQNALLKTLEEPSPGTFIILVTSSEDRLLATIRSRCQRVAFTALPESVVAVWVARHAAGITDHHAQWLARFSAGSLGRVELAVKYELYDWAKSVLPLVNAMRDGRYPAPLGAMMADLMKAFAERWVDEHRGASKDAANKQAAGLMWTLITQHARHKMVEQSARCEAGNPIAAELLLEPWVGVIDAVGGAERDLASNVNMGLVCDALVAAMHRSLAPVAA